MSSTLRHIHFKNDFVLRERFRDRSGLPLPMPECDFELRYWVRPHRVFTASRIGGLYTNCMPDGDTLLVIFKDHGLCEGPLKRELHLALLNGVMPDGVQNIFCPLDTGIELWQFASDADAAVDSEIVAAYNRGPALTFDDLTPEQIALIGQQLVGTLQLITDSHIYSVSVCGALPSCEPLPEPTPEPDGYYYYYATGGYDIGAWDLLSDIEPASIDIEL